MGAVADGAASGSTSPSEQLLAPDQRRSAQVVSVEIEAIERVVDEPVVASLAEIRLQERELGDAAFVLDHQFAIEQGVAQGQVASAAGTAPANFSVQSSPARVDQVTRPSSIRA